MITITKPSASHVEAIATVCSVGWKQTVEGKLSEEYQEETVAFWYNHDRIRKELEAGSYTHVALIGSTVVGVIGGGITGPGAGEVFVLYVDEDHRYKGIGRELLNALTQLQLEKGASKQWVSVQEDNHRGIPFYEARGFLFKERRSELTSTGEQQVSLRYSRPI